MTTGYRSSRQKHLDGTTRGWERGCQALALTGYISAWLGDATKGRAVARLLLGGTVAMALTYVIGHTFGVNA